MTPPTRQPNRLSREREYLKPEEVASMVKAARKCGRHRTRDALMIRMAYAHGFRASELCRLKWHQIDLKSCQLHVNRLKNGKSAIHPLQPDVMRMLRKLRPRDPGAIYVFRNSRGGTLSPRSFHRIVQRAGELAKMPFPVHPHMLRHAMGYFLINNGWELLHIQNYLGHRNIANTVRYTELNSSCFAGLEV